MNLGITIPHIVTAAYYSERQEFGDSINIYKDYVNELLDDAVSIGASHIRIFGDAFYQFRRSASLMIPKGDPSEQLNHYLNGLDYVLHQSFIRGLKVIVIQHQPWPDSQRLTRELTQHQNQNAMEIMGLLGSQDSDYFYKHSWLAEYYFSLLLDRVNTYTGVSYKNDDTIDKWVLTAEPKLFTVSPLEFNRWLSRVSEVARGYQPVGVDLVARIKDVTIYGCGGEGTNGSKIPEPDCFVTPEDVYSSDINFIGLQLYPYLDEYNIRSWEAANLIESFGGVCRSYGKDAYLSEFSVDQNDRYGMSSIICACQYGGLSSAILWRTSRDWSETSAPDFARQWQNNDVGFHGMGSTVMDAYRVLSS